MRRSGEFNCGLFVSSADIYILSKSETEISDSYSLLMENLLHVSAALSSLEMTNKSGGSGGPNSGGGGGGSGSGMNVSQRPPSSTGLAAAITVTPETSPSSAMPTSVLGSGGSGGLRDTVDIITTL